MRIPFRYAARRLRQSPAFTIVSVLILGLGIALSTSAFSMLEHTLLRAMPFRDPGKLVRVFTASNKDSAMSLAPGNAIELRSALSEVGEFCIYMHNQTNFTVPGEPPQQQYGIAVTANFLRLLDIQPLLGRGFLPEEDQPGKPRAILLTYAFWHERFGGDANVLGKSVKLGEDEFTIVGVLPPRFSEPLLWRNIQFVNAITLWPDWSEQRKDKWLDAFGRLKSGLSRSVAQARLDLFTEQVRLAHPVEMQNDRFRFASLGTSFAPSFVKVLYFLIFGLATSVLAIACANLGGVQLARAVGRRGELAIRSALGASRRDLIVALTTESVLIAGLGTILGIGFAYVAVRIFNAMLGADLDLNAKVLAFSVLAGGIAVLFFGVVPAWLSTSAGFSLAAEDASRTATGGRAARRMKALLIVGQFAVAVALTSATLSFGLGARAFLHRDRGWRTDGIAAGYIDVGWNRQRLEDKNPQVALLLEEKLRAIAGVDEVGLSSEAPFYGFQNRAAIAVEGRELAKRGEELQAFVLGVNPTFLSVMGIRVREGSGFDSRDKGTGPWPVLVTNRTARRLWPNESAVGKRLKVGDDATSHEVVGVVSDAIFNVGYDLPAADLQIFRPLYSMGGRFFCFALRTNRPAGALEKEVRKTVAAVESNSLMFAFGDLSAMITMLEQNKPLEIIFACFACSGLIIALIGLYGVMSQFAEQRRREIGVRMAVGADYRRILSFMLGHVSRTLIFGVVLGGIGSFLLMRILQHTMPALPSPRIMTTGVILFALGFVGLLTAFLPARRAAKCNPSEVLRAE